MADVDPKGADMCPICGSQCLEPERPQPQADASIVNCTRCGEYMISRRALVYARRNPFEPYQAAYISHFVRSRVDRDETPNLTDHELERLGEIATRPTVQEQHDRLILWLGNIQGGPGGEIKTPLGALAARLGAESDAAALFFLKELSGDLVIVDHTLGTENTKVVRLTLQGWRTFEKLSRGYSDQRTAFMAMKFGDDEIDRFVRETLVPAVKQTGYGLRRSDDDASAGLIDVRMQVQIRLARFVIADLTHQSHGAYWEAGFAQGLGKPVIYTCRADWFNADGTHFDTEHHHTIAWDPSAPHRAAESVKSTIRATLPDEAKMTDS